MAEKLAWVFIGISIALAVTLIVVSILWATSDTDSESSSSGGSSTPVTPIPTIQEPRVKVGYGFSTDLQARVMVLVDPYIGETYSVQYLFNSTVVFTEEATSFTATPEPDDISSYTLMSQYVFVGSPAYDSNTMTVIVTATGAGGATRSTDPKTAEAEIEFWEAACTDTSQCQTTSLVCSSVTNTCVAPQGVDGACATISDCASGLVCDAGACVVPSSGAETGTEDLAPPSQLSNDLVTVTFTEPFEAEPLVLASVSTDTFPPDASNSTLTVSDVTTDTCLLTLDRTQEYPTFIEARTGNITLSSIITTSVGYISTYDSGAISYCLNFRGDNYQPTTINNGTQVYSTDNGQTIDASTAVQITDTPMTQAVTTPILVVDLEGNQGAYVCADDLLLKTVRIATLDSPTVANGDPGDVALGLNRKIGSES
mmetsp:Transcript_18382/g.35980  ORF Transcript_18382/g.35980 Transcript_18382/m.35980 type:complete len:427 (-) Transcript_18382:38-1318(-)